MGAPRFEEPAEEVERRYHLPKAESGFPPRQRSGERKDFSAYDPERHPIAMLNSRLDDLRYTDDEAPPITRPQRQWLEAYAANNAHPPSECRWAEETIRHYEGSAFRMNRLHQALSAVLDIVEVHGEPSGLAVETYRERVRRCGDHLQRTTGRTHGDETPVPRSVALEVRTLLVDLKQDLEAHHVVDRPQREEEAA